MLWPPDVSVPPYSVEAEQHQQSDHDQEIATYSTLASLSSLIPASTFDTVPGLSTEGLLIPASGIQSMQAESQSVVPPSQLDRPLPPPSSTIDDTLRPSKYVKIRSNIPSAQNYELYGQSPSPIIMSAYRLGQAYKPYGPIYQFGSDPKAEKYHWTLFRADKEQFWMSPRYFRGVPAHRKQSYAVPFIKQAVVPSQSAQATSPKKKVSRRQTLAQARLPLPREPFSKASLPSNPVLSLSVPMLDTCLPAVQAAAPSSKNDLAFVKSPVPQLPCPPSMAASNAPMDLVLPATYSSQIALKPAPLKLKQSAKQRTSLTREKSVAAPPPSKRTTPERKVLQTIGAFLYPKSVTPPSLILHRRSSYSGIEIVLRRIASFLEAEDAVNFAHSNRVVFAALDYQWWGTVYGKLESESMDGRSASWPMSSGWCDHCKEFHAHIIVQEPSKARLCPDCFELPSLKNIRVSQGRELHNVNGKMGQALMKLLPFQMMDKRKFHWLPHYKWVEGLVNPSQATNIAPSSFKREPRTRLTPANLFKSGTQRVPMGNYIKRAASIKAHENILCLQNADMNTEGPSTAASTTEIIAANHSFSATSDRHRQKSPEQIRLQSRLSTASRDSHQEETSGDTSCDYSLLNTQQMDNVGASNYSYTSTSQNMPALYTQSSTEEGKATKRRRIDGTEDEYSLNSNLKQQFENMYTGLSREEIQREVRYDFLKGKAADAGMRLPEWGGPLSGTLAEFVNGEWTELAKQGIEINDFDGMIRHLQSGKN